MRRTNLQRQMHRRLVEEQLVQGHLPGQIVRGMVRNFGLTLRQARLDLAQVQDEFRRQDDELRQNRWKLADLAIASDRCDREFRAAVEAGDARRAMRVEKHRCKLLGIYHADRLRTGHMPLAERMEMESYFKSDLEKMYAQAPRNPDGSVVLTAFSLTPPPVDDPRYCRNIERPIVHTSPKRRERIDTMRAMLAVGGRMDQLEAAARETYKLSARQVRADVRRLQEQLETAGYAMHQGMHDVQLLPLALRRRERIVELALKPVGRIANPSEKPAAEPSESASGNSQRKLAAPPDASVAASVADSLRESEGSANGKANSNPQSKSAVSAPAAPAATGPPAASDQSASGNSQSDLPTHTPSKAAKSKPKPPDVRLAAEVEIDRCRLLGLYPRQRPKPEEDQLLWTPPKWDLGRRDKPAGAGGAGEILRCAQNDSHARDDVGAPNDSRVANDGFAQHDHQQPLPPASPWDEPGPYANLPHDDVGGRIDNPSYGEAGRRMDNLPYGRPLSDFERPDSNLDRMVEEDFAVRDARRGIRHTAAELLRDPLGGPGRAGREPWKPPPEGA